VSDFNRICAACIREPYLGSIIASTGIAAECDYCAKTAPTVILESLVDRCEHIIETFYEPTSLEDSVVIYGRAPVGDSVRDVLEELIKADDDVLDDLTESLADRWFDRDSHQHRYGDDPHFAEKFRLPSALSVEWRKMEASLSSEARIVNPKVNSILERIFGPLLNYRTASGNGVIVDAGPGTALSKLYRARVFQTLEDLENALSHPAREAGPPPSDVARAGRMNARGVSVFYGASISEIAVAEVRPPVGSHVLVGAFNITRKLKILNLDKLEELVLDPNKSLFDPSTEEVASRNKFLHTLSSRMVMPVMPEKEDNGYLITQAIADFLATHSSLNLDGILFRSVQYQGSGARQGRNFVLFNKASRVLSSGGREVPTSHVQLFETDEDGDHWNPEISVIHPEDRHQMPHWFADPDERAVTLEIDLNELEVQEVKGVNFTTERTHVTKYNDPKRDRPTKEGCCSGGQCTP
jgi:hypothetical protein